MTQFVIMSGINLENIWVTTTRHIQRVFVLFNVYLGLLAAATTQHRFDNSTVFEGDGAKV